MDLPNSTYGHRRARALAQEAADKAGRKAYLQIDSLPYPSTRMEVVIMTDGRGPLWLGMPWREFYPRRVNASRKEVVPPSQS